MHTQNRPTRIASLARHGFVQGALLLGILVTTSTTTGCKTQLTSNEGSLSGTICDDDGTPLNDALIIADTPSERLRTRTDTGGGWALALVPATSVEVSVTTRGVLRVWNVEVRPGEELIVVDEQCPNTGPGPSPGVGPGVEPGVDGGVGPGVEPGVEPDAGPGVNVPLGVLTGCLCDFKNGAWVGSAEVTLDRDDADAVSTTTDADGCFTFFQIQTGTWALNVSHNGFEVAFFVDVVDDEITTLDSPTECRLPPTCQVDAEITPSEAISTPVDIIFVIDSSGSMDDEIEATQQNMNRFSQDISASGVDHHVIVIGERSSISVPAPLGVSPDFLHVDVEVGSWDALEVFIESIPLFENMLRPDSKRHIVIISDDDSDMNALTFRVLLDGLPGRPFGDEGDDWSMHSIVGYGSNQSNGCNGAADLGSVYIELSQSTGGVLASICDADFSPVFDAISDAVEISAALPCAFQLPPAPDGFQHDVDQVTVRYSPVTGDSIPMSEVSGLDTCTDWGWYLEQSPLTGTSVVSCPNACTALRADGEGVVSLSVGCSAVP